MSGWMSGEGEIERYRTDAPKRTEEIAAELALRLKPGDAVLIEGGLGAGKTTFVRGAARALGVTDPVTSPTFTIGQRYDGPVPVSHLDLYRLHDLSGEDPGLLDDYLTPDAIAFVEWPGTLADAEATTDGAVIRVGMVHAGGDAREITIERVR